MFSVGAQQLAGQVIGQALVVKPDDPGDRNRREAQKPASGTRVTRATKSLHQILAERRRRDDERERLEEQEEEGARGVAQQALERYEKDMAAAQLSRKTSD